MAESGKFYFLMLKIILTYYVEKIDFFPVSILLDFPGNHSLTSSFGVGKSHLQTAWWLFVKNGKVLYVFIKSFVTHVSNRVDQWKNLFSICVIAPEYFSDLVYKILYASIWVSTVHKFIKKVNYIVKDGSSFFLSFSLHIHLNFNDEEAWKFITFGVYNHSDSLTASLLTS